MATADWFFDFVRRSRTCRASSWRCSVRRRGSLPAGIVRRLARSARAQGPAEIPRKRVFTYRYAVWQAKRLGIPFKMPPEIRSTRCRCCASRSRATARRTPCTGSFASCGATAACRICRSSGRSWWRTCACPTRRRASRSRGEGGASPQHGRGHARGVFGVPTLVIGDELFWGADATLMAADFVADGCRWTDPESDRVAALPVGAARRVVAAGTKPAAKRRRRSSARSTTVARRGTWHRLGLPAGAALLDALRFSRTTKE